ncbi:hypothetical protein ABT300_36670 [Streptomyces sp. NPDC001027]|uniref:hypothetical protein n=1 Tax=Streptomyces sp. NPDC001027 TaxID=3154771 RepID=UPI0033175BD0
MARNSAVKARTWAINQIRALTISAPREVRDRFRGLSAKDLISALARSAPPETSKIPLTRPAAPRRLARHYQALDGEIKEAEAEIGPLVTKAAPKLLALPGVGAETAGQLLETAGDNPERLRSEASFAHLLRSLTHPCVIRSHPPPPAHRGGDRQADRALHTIVLVRMKYDLRTQKYVARSTADGLSKKDIIRCLKRFVARAIYHLLPRPQLTTEQLRPTA